MDRQALIIIDLQQGVEQFSSGLYNKEPLLTAVNARIATYRCSQQPIIFIQHTDETMPYGSPTWQLFEQLDQQPTDYYLTKTHANSFYQTELTQTLQQLHISTLEFCGAQTEYCVDTTIRVAHSLGYNCLMQRGLSTTSNNDLLDAKTIIAHHEALWDHRFLTFF